MLKKLIPFLLALGMLFGAGAAYAAPPRHAGVLDFDGDGDVDETDLSAYVRAWTAAVGTSVPTPTATMAVQPTIAPTEVSTATPVPVPTHDHSTATPAPLACSNNRIWHGATLNGQACGHEHGEAPPSWLPADVAADLFNDAHHTSGVENSMEANGKHVFMKAYRLQDDGVDAYFVLHGASNPQERSGRFHSAKIWARDPSGNISTWQGWINYGAPGDYPAGDRFIRESGQAEPSRRPIMLVSTTGRFCEQWYGRPAGALGNAGWMWDLGLTFCGTNVLYRSDEASYANDRTKWPYSGNSSLTRRIEAAWYGGRDSRRGEFWADQFGNIMSGPTDPLCGQQITVFGSSYTRLCLRQFIAPTMPTVQFPGNAFQQNYQGPVTNPN